MCGSLSFFPPGVFLSPLLCTQKAVRLLVWNDSCHNYSQVNTGRRRGWGRIEAGRRGEKRRGKREPCGCLAATVWKMETTQSGSAAACQFQVWRRRVHTRGVRVRTRANWNTQEDVYCTRRDAFDKLKRRFAYSLLHLSFSVWFKRPPRVFLHCETMQTMRCRLSNCRRFASALAKLRITRHTRTPQCCLFSDLSNMFTQRVSSLSPSTYLACERSYGGNRFGLHACVFLCAGQTSLISLGDSCGKCPARLPVINVSICSHPSVNFWIRLACCDTLV